GLESRLRPAGATNRRTITAGRTAAASKFATRSPIELCQDLASEMGRGKTTIRVPEPGWEPTRLDHPVSPPSSPASASPLGDWCRRWLRRRDPSSPPPRAGLAGLRAAAGAGSPVHRRATPRGVAEQA